MWNNRLYTRICSTFALSRPMPHPSMLHQLGRKLMQCVAHLFLYSARPEQSTLPHKVDGSVTSGIMTFPTVVVHVALTGPDLLPLVPTLSPLSTIQLSHNLSGLFHHAETGNIWQDVGVKPEELSTTKFDSVTILVVYIKNAIQLPSCKASSRGHRGFY